MKVIKTKFKNLKIIKSEIYKDPRGELREVYRKKLLKENLIFDYYTTSKKNVIRGFHFQVKNQQAKLISVLKGKILDVCVDLRKTSKTFGKCFKIVLSEKSKTSIYIPKGFAHAFCAIENFNLIYYKNSTYWDKKSERGIIWNDPKLKIKWPITKPIISKKDKENMALDEFLRKYKGL